MAYNPISGFTLQIVTQAGEVASDYYLKFYEANTTTPLSMATDSAGGTLLVKAKLSDSGFPISNPLDNSTVFIPHMNANYRMVVYTSEADADANNTAAAYVNIPFVSTLVGASSVGTAAYLDTGTAAGELPTNGDLPTFGTAAEVDTGTGASNVPTNSDLAPYLGRNLIINGDFSVWQRGTSFTSAEYTSDRFQINNNGSTHVTTQQAHTLGQTDVAGNPEFYSRTVATSVAGAGNFVSLEHRLEGVELAAGQEVMLSFDAKADSSKNIASEFTQEFGTGGSPSSSAREQGVTTHALTTSWQRFTVTATLASVSGKTLGTDGNDYLRVIFWMDAGSDFDARTNSLGNQSGTFDISNVQLEFGNKATDFEYVDPATQLARCKRYFERIGGGGVTADVIYGSGYADTSTRFDAYCRYDTKRSIPAVSYSSATGVKVFRNGSTVTSTATSIFNPSINTVLLTITTSGLTAGTGGCMGAASSNDYLDINAEL